MYIGRHKCRYKNITYTGIKKDFYFTPFVLHMNNITVSPRRFE